MLEEIDHKLATTLHKTPIDAYIETSLQSLKLIPHESRVREGDHKVADLIRTKLIDFSTEHPEYAKLTFGELHARNNAHHAELMFIAQKFQQLIQKRNTE